MRSQGSARAEGRELPSGVRKLAVLLVAIGLATSLLCGLELAAQVTYRVARGKWPALAVRSASHAALFTRHPYLVAAPTPNGRWEDQGVTISIDAQGVRETGAPALNAVETRIACLGGSTTFGTRVSDEDTWPAQLQGLLGSSYAVLNFGAPGYSTTENIVQLALIVPEFKPDIVVLYVGWNDIHNYHDPEFTPDYVSHARTQLETFSLRDDVSLTRQLADRSGLVRLSRAIGLRLAELAGTERTPALTDREPDPRVDRVYERNLRTLKTLGLNLGATVYFIPQVLNDAYHDGEGSREWTSHIPNNRLPELLVRFNRVLDTVCEDGGCTVVREIEEVEWAVDDFVDDGHFSKPGGRRFAEILATRIGSPD